MVLASEKGSAFHPLIISRLAVNGVGRLARWVHVKQGSSWDIIFCHTGKVKVRQHCVRFLFRS
jgi:hypothetical protein